MFWNPQDLLYMMVTETIEIDAAWTEKLTKTSVPFSYAPTVGILTFLVPGACNKISESKSYCNEKISSPQNTG